MPGFHTKVKFSRSLSLLGHDFWGHTQIPLGVYKGLLKFTSYTAGGMAASGNLLGGETPTKWPQGSAVDSSLHCPSASCILINLKDLNS